MMLSMVDGWPSKQQNCVEWAMRRWIPCKHVIYIHHANCPRYDSVWYDLFSRGIQILIKDIVFKSETSPGSWKGVGARLRRSILLHPSYCYHAEPTGPQSGQRSKEEKKWSEIFKQSFCLWAPFVVKELKVSGSARRYHIFIFNLAGLL